MMAVDHKDVSREYYLGIALLLESPPCSITSSEASEARDFKIINVVREFKKDRCEPECNYMFHQEIASPRGFVRYASSLVVPFEAAA